MLRTPTHLTTTTKAIQRLQLNVVVSRVIELSIVVSDPKNYTGARNQSPGGKYDITC